MALVFRSVLEVEAQDLGQVVGTLFLDWVSHKTGTRDLPIINDGEPHFIADGLELAAIDAEHDGVSVFRARLYERREAEEVRTTLTALDGPDQWTWVDVERWAEDAWQGDWLPYAPGVLRRLLSTIDCRKGVTGLDDRHHVVTGEGGALLAEQILSPDRQIPIVVVTPTAYERDHDLTQTQERAKEVHRRVAGIAPVYVLGPGAVQELSKGMLRAGDEMDVHSGAIRTYLPGAGGDRDRSFRHRYVPFARLRRGPAAAGRLVSPALLRVATHQAPPEAWRKVRDLPELISGGVRDSVLSELIDVAEADLEAARLRTVSAEEQLMAADLRAAELEAHLELERETQAELLAEREDLVRRVRFLEAEARKRGEVSMPLGEADLFIPDFCEDVVAHVRNTCAGLVLGPRVDEGAAELDDHAEPSWARKALMAFEALQAYVDAKGAGAGENFRTFCSSPQASAKIPTSWIALTESETTDSNDRFRSLRTFPVDARCSSSGSVYMPAHIKLEKGGYPAPRIHFLDDTAGATGRIHVGWLGPHLDSKSKD